MKKITIIIFFLTLFACDTRNKRGNDPCPDMAGGIYVNVSIFDKVTGEDLIGYGKTYHPDSVRFCDLFGDRTCYRFIKNSLGIYYTSSGFGYVSSNFLIKLSSTEQDTLKIVGFPQKSCELQSPYKIYYKNNLIMETSGNDYLRKTLNINIKK